MRTNNPSPVIGIHLDLKGVLFKPAYIPQLLADLAGQGVNTVLVEYEDVFPFHGMAIAHDPAAAWSRATLRRFLAEAGRHRIEVIPLQQCLGHLEYLLGWKRYRAFALDRSYPSVIDVSNPKALALIFEMLRQVIEAHPHSRYVHVGMDEAHTLLTHARATRQDVVALFLEHLERLCTICERHGKTPILWSDMLEDNVQPASLQLLKPFKDRVVLCPWDYGSKGERIAAGRIAGHRVSRAWRNEPENPEAPPLGAGSQFIEDLPQAIRAMVKPWLHGRYFTPMFQADLWKRMGFRVLGASAVRCSSNMAVLPFYNHHLENVRAWSRAVKRAGILGQIGTSWARGTSWCPPGFNIDLTWPLIAELARTMGARPKPFWPGIPGAAVDRIVRTLGRCRADWRLEGQIADEMDRLAPKLKDHRHEWQSLTLMARTLQLQRQAEFNLLEVDFFHANCRPVDSEWQRRLREQQATLRAIAILKKKIHAHFSRRYHGAAFEEWFHDLFDLHVARIKDCRPICRAKCRQARRFYRGIR